jgi:polysaccharide biosynthesis/export protein
VIEALAMAGGAGKDAQLKGARIIRKTPQGVHDIPVPLKEILAAKTEDMNLQPGDVLFIPSSHSEGKWKTGNAILQAATLLAVLR